MKYCLFLTFLVLQSGLLNAQKDHLFGEIQKIIKNEEDVDLTNASGTVIGIIDWDSTYTYSIGTLEQGSKIPISDSTLMPTGGLTHAHLTLLAYHMFQLGLISQQDTLSKYKIPAFENTWINRLTIGQLMTHTSGLPKLLPGLASLKSDPDDPYISISNDTIDKYLVKWSEKNPLKTGLPLHSHYNYYLLAKVLWMVKDKRVHDNGRFIPEMDNTFFSDASAIKSLEEWPALYTSQARKVSFQHLNGFTNSMGMISTLHDLMILGQVYLRLSNQDNFRKFSFSSPELMKNKKKDEIFTSGGFRQIVTKKSGNLYFMTGVMRGGSAYIGLMPKTHTAVIILSNSGTSVHTLGLHIMRMINYQFTRTY